MSVFHSTVTRRDFMKGLGLAGAGIGTIAASAPVVHDLDELLASESGMVKHPWYVKERELLNPTTEVDWSIMERYVRQWDGQVAHVQATYYGTERYNAARANSAAVAKQQLQNNVPGFGHKWEALRNCLGQSHAWSARWTGPEGASLAKTPEELGVPKWQGTAEENSRLLLAATRLFGAGELGFAELDATYRNKLVLGAQRGTAGDAKYADLTIPYPPPSIPYVYEDVPVGYYTATKRVIPTSQQYVIFVSGPEPRETDRTAISRMSKSNLVANSGVRSLAYFSTWNFLRQMGYTSIGEIGHPTDTFNTGAIAILTGQAETARMSNWPISLAYGPRAFDFTQVINMPVAPTHPVDAGIWKFCQTCGLCAEACPSNSIPKKDDPRYPDGPSYEMPPIEGKPDTQHAHGPKIFFFNGSSCNLWRTENFPGSGCSLCAAECTFSVGNEALVHKILKTVVANTSLFNGFLAQMGNTFGYGAYEDPEEWWNLSLPMGGIDSTVTAVHGGYKK